MRNDLIPSVYFTDFLVNGKNLLPNVINQYEKDYKIKLNYDERNISIRFVALSFASPGANRYAYRMSNVDNDWIYYEKCENSTDEKTASFWRAPVEKINGKDQVNEEKEELVCKPKDGVGHRISHFACKVFCNGRFIAHASAEI